ncbi:MAG: thiamine pyrophosphate-dependent enzyme, partial [Nitrospinota bacterium]
NTPESHLQSGMWNSMGFSLPSAIVAKLVHPRRQVVGVAGDGAFLMSLGDFGTALEQDANVVMVILNDSAFGMIYKLQTKFYGRAYGYEIASPNFAEVARSFGAFGIRVEEPRELAGALREALSAGKPAIVDVVTGDYPYPSFELKI